MHCKAMLEEAIGSKVVKLSNDIYAETLELLARHKDMLQHLADILLTKNSLKTEEVKEILEHFATSENGALMETNKDKIKSCYNFAAFIPHASIWVFRRKIITGI